MSIDVDSRGESGRLTASIGLERKRRYASAAFLTLLILAVFWPSPVVSMNRLWIGGDIAVDELSFLGRQAPSWDVVFWCIAGLLLLTILHTSDERASVQTPIRMLRNLRIDRRLYGSVLRGLGAGAVTTAAVWLALDGVVLAWAESVRTREVEFVIRLVNRLGGGMNPVMIVVFFFVAGVGYVERRWVAYSLAMGISGLSAGIIAQIIKHIIGRARPELWLGTSHYAPGASTSFPSGHTVGAFALAGVLVFGSRSITLRIIAFVLAASVGASRILAFRHWTSDVIASAAIGLVTAWLLVQVLVRNDEAT